MSEQTSESRILAEGPVRHRFRTRVDFGDVDHAGILYYPKMFHYAHLAYEDFLRGSGSYSLPNCFRQHRIGTPVVSTQAQFQGPLAHGERVEIEVVVCRLGVRSFTLGFRLCDAEDGAVRARLEVVHAVVDMNAFRSCEIPDALRTYMESGK